MLKEKLKDLDILFYIVISILIAIAILLFVQNIRLNKIIKNIYFSNTVEQKQERKFAKEYNKLLNDYKKKQLELTKLEEIIRKKNSIYNDFFDIDYQDRFFKKFENITNNNQENKKFFKNQRNNFIYHAKSEENEKEFIVKVKLPKVFDLNDVKIDLKDRNLIIKVEKQTDVSKENKKFYSYNSFFESFLIPETKAELKDVKTILNNNELMVVVPILK